MDNRCLSVRQCAEAERRRECVISMPTGPRAPGVGTRERAHAARIGCRRPVEPHYAASVGVGFRRSVRILDSQPEGLKCADSRPPRDRLQASAPDPKATFADATQTGSSCPKAASVKSMSLIGEPIAGDREPRAGRYRRSCSIRRRVAVSVKWFDSPFVRITTPVLADGTRKIAAR
jgi:hypothetical protein